MSSVTVANPPLVATRARLVGLVFRARADMASVLDRIGYARSRSDVATARAVASELDEAQRALTYLREPPDADWAAVFRRLADLCTGELATVRPRLVQAAAVADALSAESPSKHG
ncbi:MAG TPA: hypothetical protein VN848_05330 [Gemmatimonadales bacterium]|nr:hypothetical protein [Gemmatimonadales bacterium]